MLRAVAVLAGLLFAASLLVAGAVVALALVLRALLTGRRPAGVQWRMSRGRFGHGARDARTPPGEVVDVEARDVTDAPPRRLPPGA